MKLTNAKGGWATRRLLTAGSLVGLLGAVLVFAGATTAATSGIHASTPNVKGQTVRLVVTGSPGFTDADEIEFINLLKQSGLNVKEIEIDDPAASLRALISGQADIGHIADPVPDIEAVANSHAKIKWIVSTDQATDYVVVGKPSLNLTNLAGTTIASNGPGSSGVIIADAGLEAKGVDTSKIKAVTIGGSSARLTAVVAGRVDLAPLHASDAVAAINTGKVKQILNVGPALGPYLQIGLTATDSYIAAHRDVVQVVVDDEMAAERWAATNEAGYLKLAKENDLVDTLTVAQQRTVWQELKQDKFFSPNGGMCSAIINKTLQTNYRFQLLTKSKEPALSSWFDPSFVHTALKARGQSPGTC